MSRSSFVPGDAREGGAETELHGAAWTGDLERARRLIAEGSDVNHIDSAGESPIHGAAGNGNADMVSFLISVGARIDIPGTNAMTPLHWAAGWGDLPTVQVLVEAGASTKVKDDLGLTAEGVAVRHSKLEVAAYLRTANDA